MILNHPFVSFEGLWVIFEKEVKTSQFDIGFNKKNGLWDNDELACPFPQ
jgi:hypothetical protein